MRKMRIVCSLLLTCSILLLLSLSAYASPNTGKGQLKILKGTISPGTIKQVADSVPNIYKNEVLPIVQAHKSDLLTTPLTDSDLVNVTFSNPISVFSSKTKYLKNEKFKDKLTLVSWQIIVYFKGNPVIIFDTSKTTGQYHMNFILNQNVANSYKKAMNQLGATNVSVLPVGSDTFLADDNDNVAFVEPANSNATRPLTNFKNLDNAVNQQIMKAQTNSVDGGGSIVNYLYGNQNSITDKAQSISTMNFILGIMSTVVLIIGAIFFTIKLNEKGKSR
ncbi:MAG: hypothetical protein FWC47_04175 [Oscillospiraceae bacterium]|nr:hypothetical protein [Oscillospiraceae bacterium]